MNTLIAIGLRNVNRNRRRTGLTAAGIAFAIWLVGVSVAVQDGQYALQRRTATDLMTGHVQISHADWPERQSVEYVVNNAFTLVEQLRRTPGVEAVLPRIQFFGMISAGEASVAGQVIGLDFAAEAGSSTLVRRLASGVMPHDQNGALIGESMASALNVGIGDEVVVLGSDPEGSMAALSARITGLLRTGIPDLDRGLVVLPIAAVAEAMLMQDRAHVIVVRGDEPETAHALASHLRTALPAELVVRPWQEVMPEIEEAITLDRLGGYPFFGIILFLVTFSVANTFVMVVFERTREFGMLRSLGMQPVGIIALLQLESLVMWCIGACVGMLLLIATIGILAHVGISFGESLEATLEQMYMPTRMYADFSVRALVPAPLILLLTTQLAALLPALRIRRILPAVAMRTGV